MIKRIFTVVIVPDQREEFEKDFQTISLEMVNGSHGVVSVEIGYPTVWNSNEYLMESVWKDQKSLELFAGSNWNEAIIPLEMAKYAKSYSVKHFVLG